ncbi:3',5'-cyclic-AMP phosphodiesterase [uncultured Ferrimonas sp.]|uniref:3',5'-cyclic-AMP phosphodiesterase n=1 Tax=uncultured Ferrimonas sp. TaxID=432640 RepID=UPI00260B829A|nr:3',5'-cyclic-AMP phosphodiesterase [uncultured Ferrimonas sp.]
MNQPIHTFSPHADDGSVLLAQVSDPHLFADQDNAFLGVNPHASLSAVIGELQQTDGVDAVLATGDLSQDHSDEAYHLFARMMGKLPAPTFVLPGNHDSPHLMNAILTGPKVKCGRRLVIGDWQILMLDSTVVGKPSGHVSVDERTWLVQMLKSHSDMNTLVALHHHPVGTGCTWLDHHCLDNGHELLALLSRYHNVKAVIWGHVHQEMDQKYQHLRLLAVPSTSIQFLPNSHNFVLDSAQPGYRLLRLYPDGSIDTVVKRLSCGQFTPDGGATGY